MPKESYITFLFCICILLQDCYHFLFSLFPVTSITVCKPLFTALFAKVMPWLRRLSDNGSALSRVHCKKKSCGSGYISGSIWKSIQIYLDFCPSLKCSYIWINFQLYPYFLYSFLMCNSITESTKSYIVGHFFDHPDMSGFLSSKIPDQGP
jgi:hypothetical protein